MPTLSVQLSDVLHASVLDLVPGRFASLDWFVERTLLDKVSAVRTEEAAPPRLHASAYRIAGAIVLTSGLHAKVPVHPGDTNVAIRSPPAYAGFSFNVDLASN